VHIVELSTALVDTKVIYSGLPVTQNQCLQCVTPASTHTEIPRPCDATELNSAGMIKLGKTEFINFSERDVINNDSSFCLHILLAIDLLCHIFPFENLWLNVHLSL